jgi:hypothetical protein
MEGIDTQLIKKQGVKDLVDKKKKWRDIDGKPTDNEDITHWDESGFLEIREELEDTSG